MLRSKIWSPLQYILGKITIMMWEKFEKVYNYLVTINQELCASFCRQE